MTAAERVLEWKRAREREREAAARVPFCSFDSTPELTLGKYRARVTGNRLVIWRARAVR